MSPVPSQGGQSCCLVLRSMCPARAGPGEGSTELGGWAGQSSDHYLQVSLGDGLLLHSELQVLHLPAGEEGAERAGLRAVGLSSGRAERGSDHARVTVSRASWKPLALPTAGSVLCSETTSFSKTGACQATPFLPRVAVGPGSRMGLETAAARRTVCPEGGRESRFLSLLTSLSSPPRKIGGQSPGAAP